MDGRGPNGKASSIDMHERGWALDVVTDVDAMRRRLCDGHYRVGVVVLCERTLGVAYQQFLERARGVDWIALVAPQLLGRPTVAALISNYCYDYHVLPAEPYRLAAALDRARRSCRMALADEDIAWRQVFGAPPRSETMQLFADRLHRVAALGADVLIVGEQGSGKERAARALHRLSTRRSGPYVRVDCAALTDMEFDSELFGDEVPWPIGRQIGRLELADCGTLQLDEIGRLTPWQQARLLRFLDERKLTRLRDGRSKLLDTRIVATTSEDLGALVSNARMREDLYHRIDTVRLRVPPLRERPEDIEPLAGHLLRVCRRAYGEWDSNGFTPEALRMLRAYAWPGNVRELESTVERAAALRAGREIRSEDLALEFPDLDSVPLLADARNAAERQALAQALGSADGNPSRAARVLGLSRVTFYRLLRKHNLAVHARVSEH